MMSQLRDHQIMASSLWHLLINLRDTMEDFKDIALFNGSQIWKLKIPFKNQMLIWLVMHNSIPTFSILRSRGIHSNDAYAFCQSIDESPSHLLHDCYIIANYWLQLGIHVDLRQFFNFDLRYWLKSNAISNINSNFLSIPWSIIFIPPSSVLGF